MPELQTDTPADAMRLSELVAETDSVEPPDEPDETGKCMICGLGGPIKPVRRTNGVFSSTFTTDYALFDGDGICYRCEHFAGEMDYRRYHWVATPEDGVQIIKERPDLLDVLLDPPEGPWMLKYKNNSDFLPVFNGWIVAQTLNTSREDYQLLVDKRLVNINRERFADMIEFGQQLRSKDDEPSKRALKGPVRAADLARYDFERDEVERINNDLTGREDWRIAVQLIQ
ncbi:hypothetical protein [Haloarcula sp. Atlit-7R]|uniref:hypothetical protein n=1 Tax=Haloarcula sp. Atlit-7R TaxID=2282125 RepID=UPI000EF175B6|nr:hypothetical protein [Haloarcula sp. Atlit-7R]RLM94378.1 hypothetical protein D3D01_16070 [Haloarcula sp. Atlit-7R]